MRAIGQSVTRIDAAGKVTGETAYPGDLNMPDQAYMKILFADRLTPAKRNLWLVCWVCLRRRMCR